MPQDRSCTNDQLQERTENYEPTATDRNSVAKARSSQQKKNSNKAEENVAIKINKAETNYQL